MDELIIAIKQEPEETIFDVSDHDYALFKTSKQEAETFGSFMSEVEKRRNSSELTETLKVENNNIKSKKFKIKTKAESKVKLTELSSKVSSYKYSNEEFEEKHKIIGKATTFKCKFCEFKTKYDPNLLMHVRAIHKKQKDYKCHICLKRFNHPSNRNRHIRKVHKNDETRFKCKFCPKISFSRSDNLKLHLRRIHGVTSSGLAGERYVCDFCNVSFLTKISLLRHVKNHILVEKVPRNFKCPICRKKIANKIEVKNHIAAYHEIAFKCQLCEKVLRSPKTLKIHESKCQN